MIDPKQFLYISDLDGTLLTPDSSLSGSAIERINRLIDHGLKFSIATARNYDSVYPILKNLRFNFPVILFNGVYLTDFYSGYNMKLTHSVPTDVLEDLLSLAEPMRLDPFVYTFNDHHQVYYRNINNPGSRNYVNYINNLGNPDRLREVTDYDFLKTENVPGMLFIDTFDALEPLYTSLREKHPTSINIYFANDISHPGYYWLQIFHQNANKGNMLQQMADMFDIPLSSTVVFGDYLNDLEMFEIAGRAVAVENALPEVKKAADEIIGSNANFAVIEYLESVGFL